MTLAGELDDLSPAVGAAIYRLAQESITNARRHARHATRVTVAVTGDADQVRLTVDDDGSVGMAGRAPAGYGLVGMRERATLLGGTFHAGPTAEPGLAGRGDPAPNRDATMSIRVLIADDQPIVRTGLTMLLDAQPDIEVVGAAADGREAVRLALQLRPDVGLFDIRMPLMDGIEATRRLAGPDVTDPLPIVVITTFDLDEYVHGALKAGARGFLLKDAGPALLTQAIHAAADGDALIAPSVTVRLLAAFAHAQTSPPQAADRTAHRPRGGSPRAGSPRPHQQRDRQRAVHHPQHRQSPPGQPHEKARRPQPRRGRHVGPRDRPHLNLRKCLCACRLLERQPSPRPRQQEQH